MSFSRRGSSSATRTVCFLVIMGTFRTSRCSRNSRRVKDFRQQRQRKAEGTSFGLAVALSPDPASVSFDKALTDRQSQARAANIARHLGLDAMESVEDFIEVSRGNSKPL